MTLKVNPRGGEVPKGGYPVVMCFPKLVTMVKGHALVAMRVTKVGSGQAKESSSPRLGAPKEGKNTQEDGWERPGKEHSTQGLEATIVIDV